jgi:glycosyltransferase involved in cell wall biosynthesis
VSSELPSVTVLIAARPDQAEVKAFQAGRLLDYPADKIEIIVARGEQPSKQRNAGLQAAKGDLIYFLDDDSVPDPANLRRAAARFEDQRVAMVGGPNLCPPDAPRLEKVFSLVLSSWLAFGPSRARYARVGMVRPSSEKELILCNLIARRGSMIQLGGFNEALYPNEENALMDQLQKDGAILIYDPDVIVFRRPRPTLKAFVRMLITYGRGRAEQLREHPTWGSALNFVPPLFLVYLVVLPLLAKLVGPLSLIPLGSYAFLVVVQLLTFSKASVLNRVAAAPLILLTHLLYGVGFWKGLFTKLKSPEERGQVQVELEISSRPYEKGKVG